MARSVKYGARKNPRGGRKKSVRRGFLRDRLLAYAHFQAHAIVSSLGKLSRTPFSSVMTIIVLAVAVSLPGGLYVVVENVKQIAGTMESGNRISLFMDYDVSDKTGREIAKRLRKHPDIDEVTVITKVEALKEFQSFSGFGDALNALNDNPLPVVIQVLPEEDSMSSPQAVETLVKDLEQTEGVDFAQLDLLWVKRLQTIVQIATRGVGLISVLLGIGVLLIIGNTVRLELQSRRDEVVISKLVGATNAFIRRPFVYAGFWYGFLSGVLAWFIITVNLFFLVGPVRNLSLLYDSGLRLLFLGFGDSLLLILISTLLGVAGSGLTLIYYIHKLNPE